MILKEGMEVYNTNLEKVFVVDMVGNGAAWLMAIDNPSEVIRTTSEDPEGFVDIDESGLDFQAEGIFDDKILRETNEVTIKKSMIESLTQIFLKTYTHKKGVNKSIAHTLVVANELFGRMGYTDFSEIDGKLWTEVLD